MTVFHRLIVVAASMLVCFCAATLVHAAPNEALCDGKGTVDEVKPIPPSLAVFAKVLFGDDAKPVYRCMDDVVFLCDDTVGQSFGCAKADTRRDNPGVTQFCKENPDAPVAPMAASGRATIYSWKCARGKPVITSVGLVDARGYHAENWIEAEGVR
ncbi:hypothetical protein SAMN05519104_0696 [Rhizobiales bacterium GAS188]|nr:hypothetical protein SAMN05519104_0696 [Rhizobiales bacterium GAS188]